MIQEKGKGSMQEIDFVIPWVDGNDPQWQERKKLRTKNSETTDERPQRYRDWDLLRFWFRGVEKYTPWVRKIWFVCDQQPPVWLNEKHPKLSVVRHEQFIPSQYLPVFSVNPIELNMHRIQGLSDRFVYFNDDTFLLRPVSDTFFFKNGLPRDSALLNPVPTDALISGDPDARIITYCLNNAEYINRDFRFRAVIRQNILKWLNPGYGADLIRNLVLMIWPRFVGFVEPHLPQAFLKSSFEEAWLQDGDILDATSRHPFRDDRDVNQWLIRDRQLAAGRFIPRKPLRHLSFIICNDEERMHRTIRDQLAPMICLNDAGISEESVKIFKQKLQEDFMSILPEKSTFER